MLFNTYNPGKFAFSQEIDNLEEIAAFDESDFVNTDLNSDDSDFVNTDFDSDKSDFIKNNQNSWGIIGVPFDSTCSYHHGSRYGPTVIREASFGFEQYNIRYNSSLNSNFYDFGDLNIIHGNCNKTVNILEEEVNELLISGINPIIIGGEHSISFGSIKALANLSESKDLSDFTIIHLDAHRDIIDTYQGEKDSHATIMRRVNELNPKNLIQIGIRSSSLEEEEYVNENENIINFLAKDILDNGFYSENSYLDKSSELKDILTSINGKVYISIDMDVIDPAFAPSLGNPCPGGLSPSDIEDIFEILANNKNIDIVGFDLVEVATDKLGDITAIAAAKIIYDFLTLFS